MAIDFILYSHRYYISDYTKHTHTHTHTHTHLSLIHISPNNSIKYQFNINKSAASVYLCYLPIYANLINPKRIPKE